MIRKALRLGERVAPRAAGRFALRLWCTPPSDAGRKQDNRPGPGVESEVTPTPGHRIRVETWSPPGSPDGAEAAPTIYLVHGWGGWRGQLGAFVEPLLAAGFRVIGFDAPAHGGSGPGQLGRNQASAIEFAEALRAVIAEHGPAAGIIAHSLGSATTVLALRDGLSADRLVLIAPNSDPMLVVDRFRQQLGLGRRSAVSFLVQLHRLAGRPLTDLNGLTVPAWVPRPPTLIIHDRDDRETPFVEGRRFAEQWPATELIGTEGLGHHRILRDPAVVAAAVGFLRPDLAGPESRDDQGSGRSSRLERTARTMQ
ncbi:alpha/beta fold hydrolase [Microlunatus speluncae]|uniref:alpha/beta fold hydrolase n=1 Tax=Microlunatus speluncae TaxID=2594267 RepID=UPI00137548B5|nr:alpha/beta fold hydrolase [Microlunatus speluncae]